jgi:tetratricopeptide (TPR) repeat protein
MKSCRHKYRDFSVRLISGMALLGMVGLPWTLAAATGVSKEETKRISPSPASERDALVTTNMAKLGEPAKPPPTVKDYEEQIEAARQMRRSRDFIGAEKTLVNMLENELTPELRRGALFELALLAQEQKQLARAQQILAQYLKLFSQDPSVPEVLLRQGLIYRQMGTPNLAITKFYAVMNTSLGLKLEQFDYYKRLVLLAQTEIADTYYEQGKYAEAADFFGRILKQDSVELNRAQIHFKLIRCLSGLGKHAQVVPQCDVFFEKYPDAAELPELRFLCATSLKQIGRTSDALRQVLKLLESQETTARTDPGNWLYWQQRAGNDIANQLYLEGDYLNALELYRQLAEMNQTAEWQLPVWYQIGLIYERLSQPQKAVEMYDSILARQKTLAGLELPASVKTVVDMAKWRKDQISWHDRAEVAVQALRLSPVVVTTTNYSPNRP